MTTQLRETQLGHLVRLLSGKKSFQYPDEIDPSLWTKSASVSTEHKGQLEKAMNLDGPTNKAADLQDPTPDEIVEIGKDIFLVSWYSPSDPENPRNWSSNWKLLITLQICLFNFAVYIASSIYVPGEADIMKEFNVSEIVATMGLSFFSTCLAYYPSPH